jgi:Domain of unknown function (DUF4917)
VTDASANDATTVDSVLLDWDTLAGTSWPTLLLGNGYSINLWSGFRYDTLRDEAALARGADDLFNDLDTTNFEEVLEAIHHAHLVMDALGTDNDDVDDLYEEVRDALFTTIRDIHIDWNDFPIDTHRRIAEAIDDFESVFTTNYDLTLYWSYIQELQGVRIADLFWGDGNRFDPSRTQVWQGWTALYYLHGAIHLWQDDGGDNGKWTHSDQGNLLDLAGQYTPSSSRRPLFVSEGTWQAKMQSIRRAPYLLHCYDMLRDDEENTVIVGHSLSDWDTHIVEALRRGPTRQVAVSVYPHQRSEDIVDFKAGVTKALRRHNVYFFNSETHPLGNPSLNIG